MMPDLISLISAPLSELADALNHESIKSEPDPEGIPAPALQLADMIMSEVIRLIRLGNLNDMASAASSMADLIGSEALKVRYPEGYKVVSAAADALLSASGPGSSGGELMVLRSFDGKALRAATLVSKHSSSGIKRSELRRRLRIDSKTMGYLLANLSAAGLAEQLRDGRVVKVYPGPVMQAEHVQRLIAPQQVNATRSHRVAL
jgi:hypothetical protein